MGVIAYITDGHEAANFGIAFGLLALGYIVSCPPTSATLGPGPCRDACERFVLPHPASSSCAGSRWAPCGARAPTSSSGRQAAGQSRRPSQRRLLGIGWRLGIVVGQLVAAWVIIRRLVERLQRFVKR